MTTKNDDDLKQYLLSLYGNVENSIKKIDTSVIVEVGKDLYDSVSTLAEKTKVGVRGYKQDLELAYERKKRRLRRRIIFMKLILFLFVLYIFLYLFVKMFGEIKNIFGF